MALTIPELAIGVVAYFDVSALNVDRRVQPPPSPTPRNGPFVCVQVVHGRSTWAPLTWTHQSHRVLIEQQWRLGGTKAWREGTPYMNDGSTTYVGENEAFIEATATADTYLPHTRQRVSEQGVEALLANIRSRGGKLIPDAVVTSEPAESEPNTPRVTHPAEPKECS